jgi:hypothetical protein
MKELVKANTEENPPSNEISDLPVIYNVRNIHNIQSDYSNPTSTISKVLLKILFLVNKEYSNLGFIKFILGLKMI